MKKFTKLFLTLALLVVGVGTANAEIKTNATLNSTNWWAQADWDSETSTMTWTGIWAAPSGNNGTWFFIETGLPSGDISFYAKFHATLADFSNNVDYVLLRIKQGDNNYADVKLKSGENNIKLDSLAKANPKVDFTKVTDITIWGANTALTGESIDNDHPASVKISDVYLYTDRYEYQEQQQTVYTNTLGAALPLGDIVTNSTLVSIASGNEILYGKANDGSEWGSNQIKLAVLDDAMNLISGDDNTSYQFQISVATDEGLVKPDGISTLYRIKAFKADGTTPFIGPSWNGGNSFYLQEISWTYNVADGTDKDQASFFDITPVDGKTNIYKISSYKKDGSAGYKENIYNKTEWFFSVISQTPHQEDVQVLVEVQGKDTEDPGVPAPEEGWKSLITNGNLSGESVESFWTKQKGVDAANAVIVEKGGRMEGRGIKVTSIEGATVDWEMQFFVKSSEPLKEGQKFRIAFDYRADRQPSANAATAVHRNPGDHNANIGSLAFTVNWKHYDETFDITAAMCKQDNNTGDSYMLSFCLNLNADPVSNNFYFDNIGLWTEDDPCKAERVALQNAIAKGQAQNSFAKTTASFSALTDAITAGEGVVNTSNDATVLTNAATAINNAIDGFVLLPGYTNLTTDMIKKWDSDTTPTESSNTTFAINLNQSTGQPFGDSSVKWYNFADMSDFSKLVILASAGTPRIMMNREYAATGDGGNYVELTNAPADGKVEVDLTSYPYAHMNAIKGANWQNVTVSGMYLYRTFTVSSDAGMASFGTLYKTANLSGATTVYAAKYENGSVKLTAVDSKNVPAGKGVIVKGTGEIVPTFDVEADAIDTDLLVSNGTVVGDGSTIFVLADGTNGVGFYLLKEGDKVPAGKAYLKIENSGSSREFIAIDGGATAIKSVETEKANGAVYNLAGQQVKSAQKGVFIMNGKKVIK